MMKVSVIVPAYNEEKTIERTIRSLLSQTHQDYEIIVVNDASTDSTKQLLEKYSKDKRIKVINKPKNEGRPRSLKTGLETVTGDIVATTDGDSVVPKDWIERIHKNFEGKKIVGVGGTFEALDDKSIWAMSNCVKDLVFNELLGKIVTPNMLPGANSAVLASELRAVGGYPIKKWSADFNLSEMMRKRGAIIDDPDLIIKTHYPANFVGSLRRKFYWGFGAADIIKKGKNRKKFYLRPLYYTVLLALTAATLLSPVLAPGFSELSLCVTLLWISPFTIGLFFLAFTYIVTRKRYHYCRTLPIMLFYPLLLELSYFFGMLYGLFGGSVGNWKND